MRTLAADSPAATTAGTDARVAGAFYLLNILTILLAIAFKRGIVVVGDPAATAANFSASMPRFEVAWALQVISTGCSLAVAAYFYRLFAPVNRSLSLLAAFFRVVACAVAMVGYLLQAAPLVILGSASVVPALTASELHSIAYLALRLGTQASNLVIVVFGFDFIVLGYLITRSTFMPRAIGVVVGVAGIASCALLGPIGRQLFPAVLGLGAVAELSLAGWLLLAGIDADRWGEQAQCARLRG